LEDAFYFPKWSFDSRNGIVSDVETHFPLCDKDLGDKYEVTQAPGIPKDKIRVKAGTDYIEIS